MKSTTTGRVLQRFDWTSLALFSALVIIGWLMIYASSYGVNTKPNILDLSTEVGKQIIWIGAAIIILVITQVIDGRFWSSLAYPLYVLTILGLIAVLVFGVTIKGATSWFNIGGFSLQPSEFAKFGTALALSSYLSYYKTKMSDFKARWISISILLAPALLIMLQPDAGSALVFVSFFILLFRAGMPAFAYLIAISLGLLFVFSFYLGPMWITLLLTWIVMGGVLFQLGRKWFVTLTTILLLTLIGYILFVSGFKYWAVMGSSLTMLGLVIFLVFKKKNPNYLVYLVFFAIGTLLSIGTEFAFENLLKPHQQDRINVWLNPKKCDPRGALYNVLQSKIAIGSGGIKGKGYLEGTMSKLNYVPEQNTDFIFTVIGEEQGFVGAMSIILIFSFLVYRIISRGEKSDTLFAKYYAYAFAGILFTHFVINIGMTMGLFPVIGIPLPFVSYGGSSLIAFSLMMGVYLKLNTLR